MQHGRDPEGGGHSPEVEREKGESRTKKKKKNTIKYLFFKQRVSIDKNGLNDLINGWSLTK